MEYIPVYLYCFGVPLIPLLLGIAALFVTHRNSPQNYRLVLAGLNIYAMTVVPLFVVMNYDFRVTVISVVIVSFSFAVANGLAERRQPEQEPKWRLALPLSISWLIWSLTMMFLNHRYFAGVVPEWGGLVFVAVLMLGTPVFFGISALSVAFLLRTFNRGPERSAGAKTVAGDRHGHHMAESHVNPSLLLIDPHGTLDPKGGQRRRDST